MVILSVLETDTIMSNDPIEIVTPMTQHFEDLSLDPYWDEAGYPTIGYGHKLSSIQMKSLDTYPPISMDQALKLLRDDLKHALAGVRNSVKVPLRPYQMAALIDLAFNIGSEAFSRSTLVAELNEGNRGDIPHQFERWIYANHHISAGLEERRQAEARMWLNKPWRD
ncbi:MAG: lysozyme [Candidatus Poribacteria bacterium]|nr:lysozyme [Candidatus Poribacteria bacterium]